MLAKLLDLLHIRRAVWVRGSTGKIYTSYIKKNSKDSLYHVLCFGYMIGDAVLLSEGGIDKSCEASYMQEMGLLASLA